MNRKISASTTYFQINVIFISKKFIPFSTIFINTFIIIHQMFRKFKHFIHIFIIIFFRLFKEILPNFLFIYNSAFFRICYFKFIINFLYFSPSFLLGFSNFNFLPIFPNNFNLILIFIFHFLFVFLFFFLIIFKNFNIKFHPVFYLFHYFSQKIPSYQHFQIFSNTQQSHLHFPQFQ